MYDGLRALLWGVVFGLLIGCSPGRDEAARADRAPGSGAPSAPASSIATPGASSSLSSSRPATTTPGRDLERDERLGGHTLARHVGRTDDELRARLARERVSAASTYEDVATARQVVATALERSVAEIDAWARRTGGRANLALRCRGPRGHPIGRSIRRGETTPQPCYDAVIVLRWDERARDYYVLTSYPEARP